MQVHDDVAPDLFKSAKLLFASAVDAGRNERL